MNPNEATELRAEIQLLKDQIAELRAMYTDLAKAFNSEGESSTVHFEKVYQRLATAYDYVFAVYYKCFPQSVADHDKIKAFIVRAGGPVADPKIPRRG